MHQVRVSVREHMLTEPAEETLDREYQVILDKRGKGWVCEVDDLVVGFAMVDLQENNVCDLYVKPEVEGKFVGRMLHDMMTTWCFARDIPKLWLSVKPDTRAEKFFLRAGWSQTGVELNGNIRFELENNLDPSTF